MWTRGQPSVWSTKFSGHTKRNFAPNTMSVCKPGSMSPEDHNQWLLSKVERLINQDRSCQQRAHRYTQSCRRVGKSQLEVKSRKSFDMYLIFDDDSITIHLQDCRLLVPAAVLVTVTGHSSRLKESRAANEPSAKFSQPWRRKAPTRDTNLNIIGDRLNANQSSRPL